MRAKIFKLSILILWAGQFGSAAVMPQWPMMSYLSLMVDCEEGDDTCLKLRDGRFHVKVEYWKISDPEPKPGHGVSLKEETGFDETGYFWFEDPDSIDAVVRVFDGCEFNENFWVFTGSLTKVGYELTVEDTLTDTVKVYTNPDLELGAPIQDTDAFATCPSKVSAQQGLPKGDVLQKEGEILSLFDGRFLAEIDYLIPGFPPGRAKVGKATATSGAFYFLDRSDLNVYLKIIDGRPINGRHWLAYTSFTGAEYTLSITDTETGQVKTYRNELNESTYGMDTYFCDPDTKLVFPWISNSDRFDSTLIVNNRNCLPLHVIFEARRFGIEPEITERTIPSEGFLEEAAADLFPGLGEGPGYSVLLKSDHGGAFGRWVSNNRDTPSLGSPSQGVAIQIPPVIEPPLPPNALVGFAMLFGFLPLESGFFSAPVIVNVGDGPTDLSLFFYSKTGELLHAEKDVVVNFMPYQPFAAITSTYLGQMPENAVSMVAYSSRQPITGVAFIFNAFGEPALGNAQALDGFQAPN